MKKNKILTIILVFFALLIGFTSSCFASFEFNYNDKNYSFPDLPIDINNTKFMITYDSLNSCYFLSVATDNQPFKIGFNDSYGEWTSVIYSGSYSIYQTAGDDWSLLGSGDSTDSGKTCGTSPEFLYSNFDVYRTDNEPFFQKTPQLKGGVLVPVVEKVEMNKVLEEILGILPVVIMTIVGLIGLRKALKTLFSFLHKA